MATINVLTHGWKQNLVKLVRTTRKYLLISSPYVTNAGTDLVAGNLSKTIRTTGKVRVLTDLSAMNVCQRATDPSALQTLFGAANRVEIVHMPRLHAKVYIADSQCAIVTSANLTAGGLQFNHESGLEVHDRATINRLRHRMDEFAALGADISLEQLSNYCQIAGDAYARFQKIQSSVPMSAQKEFEAALGAAQDELIRHRLARGSVHAVFARTIIHVLRTHGPLRTKELHSLIEAIHPDLCDNRVDRVIDRKRFGKRWKHYVRTAQQHLKKRGDIQLVGDKWALVKLGRESTR